ncbi:MAG TPA: glycerate kinase [Gemmataceae bacterium]|nr:glycerate kinase [Gemmataceae bacterium]
MPGSSSLLREHARSIWDAAVAAARPQDLVRAACSDPSLPLLAEVRRARRILVVGAGKAGAAMSVGIEEALPDCLARIEGIVNVPALPEGTGVTPPPPRKVRLHVARPAGTNQPTAEGVTGARQILELVAHAGPEDVCLCLISGGGSALLPAPAEGLTLEDKQQVTRLLHACGATINEMNAVRKHLSAVKGGRLAQAFTGRALFSLIISDVIGDPLDVIASGPTAADPTTFADALAVLRKYHLEAKVPAAVLRHLERGAAGELPETLKVLPGNVHNYVIGNNARSLAAAGARAAELGYPVLNLGSFIEGETRQVAVALAGIVRSVRADGRPAPAPLCLLSGGETTVTLTEGHGLGGRNQEFVLAAALKLGAEGLRDVVVLSGGTDGEDGPTDAAGAVADAETWRRAGERGLDPATFLDRNDAYHFFEATGDLIRTGLTQTNVMDVRVILIA